VRRFPASPITSVIDQTPLYNLAESTCRDLTLEELLGRDGAAALGKLPIGYGTSAGDPELRRLVAASVGAPEDQVLITAGAAAALFLLGLTFGDGRGEIVVIRPCFPPMLDALRGLGASVVPVQVRFETGYRPDLSALAAALSADTKLVMLASPQNPSGVVFTTDEIDQVLTAMSHTCPDAWLLVDETFRAAVYGRAPMPTSFAGRSPRVLTCGSLSKSHGAPGLRIGWLALPDPELYDQLRLARFNTAISCGALDEHLAVELLRREDAVLAPRRAFLADALAVVEGWVTEHGDRVQWTRPDAGAFCCVRLDPGRYGPDGLRTFYSRLAERRTLVASGDWFGDSEYVFRLGFGYEPIEKLRAGLGAISAALA
jgi:aspartate/methionine/tyrosine aminotransferase